MILCVFYYNVLSCVAGLIVLCSGLSAIVIDIIIIIMIKCSAPKGSMAWYVEALTAVVCSALLMEVYGGVVVGCLSGDVAMVRRLNLIDTEKSMRHFASGS